jgi:dolichol-phosphate mannosyltransferase
MAIVSPTGELLAYPKPMTLSSHTMSAVNERALPTADRLMLAIRSRLHSREGRAVGHALGRMPIPIVTVNAWVQILIPPPKYHVTSLIDCDMADRSVIDSIILMERGEPFAELPTLDATVDRLLTNTDDAYTFPPFASFAPMLVFNGVGYDALRVRERELLEAAMADVWRVRVRVVGHEWAEIIPDLVERRRPELARRAAAIASAEAAPAPVPASATAAAAPDGEPVVVGLSGRSR